MNIDPGARELADQAKEWVVTHREVIRHVYNALVRDLDWPNVDVLQRELDSAGLDVDVLTFATQIPRELGIFDWSKRQIALKLRAIHDLPEVERYAQFVFLVVYTWTFALLGVRS